MIEVGGDVGTSSHVALGISLTLQITKIRAR